LAIYDDKWFEVWFEEGSDVIPLYLLIVTQNEKGKIVIIDPLLKNKILFEADNYEDAVHWLSEDQFDIVEGRIFSDDGW